MAIIDSKGRLFGKINILDVGAILIILAVILGVLLPSTTGVAQLGSEVKAVEIDVIVRDFSIQSPSSPLKVGDETSIVIRNQPFGEVKVLAVKEMPRNIVVPQPDGSAKSMPDPRPEASFTRDYLVTLGGNARTTKDGLVLGNNKIKAGMQIELEGYTYDFPSLIVQDVRVKS
jgi:hypothetical protein